MTLRALVVAAFVVSASGSATAEPCPDYNPLRNPYVGDLHVHTGFSFDAVLLGVSTEPDDAYAFAKGDPIELAPSGPPGSGLPRSLQLERPLDFAAVSDHAEFFGEFHLCTVPGDPAFDSPFCVQYRTVALGNRDVTTAPPGPVTLGTFIQFAQALLSPVPQRNPVCGADDAACLSRASLVWQASQDATNFANDSCYFTAFNAYEWTANTIFPDAPAGANLHRNVIFSGDSVPPLPSSYFEAPRVELLWDQLRQDCIDGDPDCDALTIPHNSNLSSGRMFKPVYSAEPVAGPPFFVDRPLTAEDAGARAAIEPVVEIMQNKGASECRISMRGDNSVPFLGSDELCDFESYNRIGILDPPVPNVPVPRLSFVREGLKEGLVQDAALGVNPFKLGMLGSTDAHNSTPGQTSEVTFAVTGQQGINDFTPQLTLSIRNGTGIEANGGGLAVVWAEQNTRQSIFDAIKRREVYGTSGTRPIVRFFGSWETALDLCDSPNAVEIADGQGVPMGADLPVRPGNKKPRFVVSAQQDPLGSPLQRVQIVKGWLDANGVAQEAIYEVAGDPENGASVDVDTCETQGSGFASLCTVWEDPAFDGDQKAFYYARILENPTCRWSQRFCADTFGHVGAACAAGVVPPEFALCCDSTAVPPLDVPQTIQERAWSSPIWYTPAPELAIEVDIKPGSCPNSFNRNSNGVLPVAILGTPELDVEQIDPGTVEICRVDPETDQIVGCLGPNEGPPGPRTVVEDVGTPFEGETCDCHEAEGDGIDDLSLKFKTADLVVALQLDQLPPGDLPELVVRGHLREEFGGTPLEGSDCVRLVPPGTANGGISVHSNAAGAWSDVSPLDLTLDGGGFASFERTYPQSTEVTLTASARHARRNFRGWRIDGGELVEEATITIPITAEDHVVDAEYGPRAGCGLGFELTLVLPGLMGLRRRKRSRAR